MKYLKTTKHPNLKKYEISDLELIAYLTLIFLLGLFIGSYITLYNAFKMII